MNPSMMRADLLDATRRLTADHPGTPAGSVIRCFAREAARARRRGTTAGQLVVVAEARTRAALARRRGPGVPAVAAG